MGVDAQILVKITNPDSWVNHQQLRQLSSRLTSIIGADHFMMDEEQDEHALRFVDEVNEEGEIVYYQDSVDDPEIVKEPNEQFIDVCTFSRYYGEDYARGDWKKLFFIIFWTVLNFKDAEVWYGGDSSGCLMELMTSEKLCEITTYFLTSGHDDYWMAAKNGYLCEYCQMNTTNNGGGGDNHFFYCAGCDGTWIVKGCIPFGWNLDRQMTPNVPGMTYTRCKRESGSRYGKKEDTFKVSNEVNNGTRTMLPFNGVFPSIAKKEKTASATVTPQIEEQKKQIE